jgi:arylsulfatase A-like enzyme
MKGNRRWVWIAVLGLGALVVAALKKPALEHLARTRFPYIVLVSLDTLNVDYTGPFNSEVQSTPVLDSFADAGVLFEHAYTQVPITLPSHTTLLTGLPPSEHGVLGNGDVALESLTTLAELFRETGYDTAAFISLGVLGRTFGLDQGFDVYGDPFLEGDARPYRYAHEVFESAQTWFRDFQGDPFFLWFHLSDPHEPYVPVGAPPDTRLSMDGENLGEWNLVSKNVAELSLRLPPGKHRLRWTSLREPSPDDRPETGIEMKLSRLEALARFAATPLPELGAGIDLRPSWDLDLVNPTENPVTLDLSFSGRLVRPAPSDVLENYAMEVGYADRYLGELRDLFERAGIGEKVLWVIVSDHGEGLFRHDLLGHAEYVFEDQLRVFWLFSGPGVPRGRFVRETPALLIDVAPTLLDLVGLATPSDVKGRSQVECWEDGRCRSPSDFWAFGLRHETNGMTALAGYRWPYKWIWRRGEGRQAHQVLDDPREQRNLLEPGRERPPELQFLAESFRAERRRLQDLLHFRKRFGDHERRLELLRSLGYIDAR